MPTAIELREARLGVWDRMRAIVDAAEAENRDLSQEEQTNWDQANTDLGALDKRIERQEQLERTPAKAPSFERATAATLADPVAKLATREYQQAFRKYVMLGDESELRSMNSSAGGAGGVAVPQTMRAGIEAALLEFGGMRQVANVISTDDGGDLVFLVSNDTGNTGAILSQGTQVSETDATVGSRILKAYTFSSKLIRVSLQLIQDAAFDVEGFLGRALGERIGRIQNTEFTTGSGANEPQGVVLGAASGVSCATGKTATCDWDDLLDLKHSVGAAYRPRARWMFADTTLKVLRKLKDGEGRYLWQPAMPAVGAVATLDGDPYVINDDVAAMAASAKSILYGDFSHYVIRDVRGFTLLRLVERYADYLQVGFTGFSRADGALIDAGNSPIKYLANSAS